MCDVRRHRCRTGGQGRGSRCQRYRLPPRARDRRRMPPGAGRMTRARQPAARRARRGGRGRSGWTALSSAEDETAVSSLTERGEPRESCDVVHDGVQRRPRKGERGRAGNAAMVAPREMMAASLQAARAPANGPHAAGSGFRFAPVTGPSQRYISRGAEFRLPVPRQPSNEHHDRVLHRLNVRAPRRQAGGGDSFQVSGRLGKAPSVLGRTVRGSARRRSHIPEIPGRTPCGARRGGPVARGERLVPPSPAASGSPILTS